MTQVGIRELKAHLSAYLKRVERGESIAISLHGVRIGTIVPESKSTLETKLRALAARGIIDWGGGKPTGLKRPIPYRGKSLSQTIIEDRKDRF